MTISAVGSDPTCGNEEKRSNLHPSRESRQAILPDALRVNVCLFQTDLCRDPEHRDVLIHTTVRPINQQIVEMVALPSMALDTGFPAGMTVYLSVYNKVMQAGI